MKNLHFGVLLLCFLAAACVPQIHHVQTRGDYLAADTSAADTKISDLIAPYKIKLNDEMGEVIGEVGVDMTKAKPESSLGNFMADLIHEKCEDYHGKKIDFTIVNYGGIRIPTLPAGEVTRGKVFELMPFDNMLVVVEIDAATVRQTFELMAANGGWPISKHVSYTIKEGLPTDIRINDEAIDEDKIYKVALSDFLANGGDKLFFLTDKKRYELGVLFRDAILEYIEENKGTILQSAVDGRVKS